MNQAWRFLVSAVLLVGLFPKALSIMATKQNVTVLQIENEDHQSSANDKNKKKRPWRLDRNYQNETRIESLVIVAPKKPKKKKPKTTSLDTNRQCKELLHTQLPFRRPQVAYSMAVLATLAYWEFHKQHTVASGFSLRMVTRSMATRVKRYVVAMITQASPALVDTGTTLPRRSYHAASKHDYTFAYNFYDWHEPSAVSGINFHDTDLLIAQSSNGVGLVVSFAGTKSAADALTNLQTFESVTHSRFFASVAQGSLHRGFLNAYARVERGSVVRLWNNTKSSAIRPGMLAVLNRDFQDCWLKPRVKKSKRTNQGNVTTHQEMSAGKHLLNNVRRRPNGSCRVRHIKLMSILRELVMAALSSGYEVQLVGHSLGGGLATIMALDIILNFPQLPVSKLRLWTFGAPQVADNLFFESAMTAAPRLRKFLHKRYHRFVTLSDHCEEDFIAGVTKYALPSHQMNLRGSAARKFGGLRGHVIHFDVTKPHYLLTPEQCDKISASGRSRTRSAIAAHSIINYLRGISRESRHHPLETNLPTEMAEWLVHADDMIDEAT